MKLHWLYIVIGLIFLLMFIWMYRRQSKFVRDLTTESHAVEVYGLKGVEKPAFGKDSRPPRERFRSVVEKLRECVLTARSRITDARLSAAAEEDRKFYIGYLREVAEVLAGAEETPISGPLLVPLSAEASRLLGNGREDFMAGEKILTAQEADEVFLAGRQAARKDNEAEVMDDMPGLVARFS
ncbi:MAG: hypothetical protein RIC36_04235 [Rhodospirillales bacterium]